MDRLWLHDNPKIPETRTSQAHFLRLTPLKISSWKHPVLIASLSDRTHQNLIGRNLRRNLYTSSRSFWHHIRHIYLLKNIYWEKLYLLGQNIPTDFQGHWLPNYVSIAWTTSNLYCLDCSFLNLFLTSHENFFNCICEICGIDLQWANIAGCILQIQIWPVFDDKSCSIIHFTADWPVIIFTPSLFDPLGGSSWYLLVPIRAKCAFLSVLCTKES